MVEGMAQTDGYQAGEKLVAERGAKDYQCYTSDECLLIEKVDVRKFKLVRLQQTYTRNTG